MCFIACINEFQIKAVSLSSDENRLSDYLSRLDLDPRYSKEYFALVSDCQFLKYIVVADA
jgi:hypothetical protein